MFMSSYQVQQRRVLAGVIALIPNGIAYLNVAFSSNGLNEPETVSVE